MSTFFQQTAQAMIAKHIDRDLCKIPFPPDSRNPNTGFRLFSYQIPPNFTQISP